MQFLKISDRALKKSSSSSNPLPLSLTNYEKSVALKKEENKNSLSQSIKLFNEEYTATLYIYIYGLC